MAALVYADLSGLAEAGSVAAGFVEPVESVDSDEPVESDPPGESESFDLDECPLPELSFRAQPVPLKWMAGAEKAFFIGPPQLAHSLGPWPWIEWTTSSRRPQFSQT